MRKPSLATFTPSFHLDLLNKKKFMGRCRKSDEEVELVEKERKLKTENFEDVKMDKL